MNEHANENIIEMHTGVGNFQKSKQEIEPMFNPQEKMSYIHGTPAMDNSIKNRYSEAVTLKKTE